MDVNIARGLRLQDSQLQEMSDDGFCLSMHQPWASYLVSGIKIHEGRTWYSAHRGRLWIHAAAKEPTKEEIAQVQKQHLIHRRGNNIMKFWFLNSSKIYLQKVIKQFIRQKTLTSLLLLGKNNRTSGHRS